ncbi:MAG TPA: pantoate--beta-alanine ligase [Mycobacteriales bacterium]|nr:pantoate--beta-alanine ligase [Mycobacteriales bacterium]
MSEPLLVRTRVELAAARTRMNGRVAVVMTMGALHRGHVELIRAARARADQVLVTIFVNPRQFGEGEDFDRYPRDLAADLALCATEGVDVVFAPTVDEIYPANEAIPTRHAGPLGARLEGEYRPGHFDGVLTVVDRLLELTDPDVAVFGEKDAQQLELIRRMVSELGRPVELVDVAVVREGDGLARSSRNAFLTPPQRTAAAALFRALRTGAEQAGRGVDAVMAAAGEVLAGVPEVALDYLALVDDRTWQAPDEDTRRARLLVAARFGTTRLIDNVTVDLGVGCVRPGAARTDPSPSEGA